jgi:hypothetical protein
MANNGDFDMRMRSALLAAAVLATGIPFLASSSANAAPLSSSLALRDAVAPAAAVTEQVQWRRHRHRHYRRGGWGGPAVAGALLGGAIIGGALASRPYGYYDYGPGPTYYYGGGYGGGDAVAYCQQRFRSYDPRSGTYLGYDGLRHPCP